MLPPLISMCHFLGISVRSSQFLLAIRKKCVNVPLQGPHIALRQHPLVALGGVAQCGHDQHNAERLVQGDGKVAQRAEEKGHRAQHRMQAHILHHRPDLRRLVYDADVLTAINVDTFPDGSTVVLEAVFGNSVMYDASSGEVIGASAMMQVRCKEENIVRF